MNSIAVLICKKEGGQGTADFIDNVVFMFFQCPIFEGK